MNSMKHAAIAAATAFLAIVITMLLSTYGGDGLRGAIAVYGGYPGGFVNWRFNPGRVNYTLITVLNWSTYFVIAESIAAVLGRHSHPQR